MVKGCGFGGLNVGVAVDGSEDVIDIHFHLLWVCGYGLGRVTMGFGGRGGRWIKSGAEHDICLRQWFV